MQLHQRGAEIFIPDNLPPDRAIGRSTHVAVGAHQDDLEIMACHGILECFSREDRWFFGITVTDGSGSPRGGAYARYTDAEMQRVRKQEQKKAATIGEYAAVALLDFPSSAVKDPARSDVVEDIQALLEAARPEVVYTHNLADKHDTHVAVALRAIAAIRGLPKADRPKALYGCEVWRDLDWMVDADKVPLDVSPHENVSASLVGVFDSQIAGGKRYDLATQGRRRAHATYFASHGTDETRALTFAMDLTPLIDGAAADVENHVIAHLDRFREDVTAKLREFG